MICSASDIIALTGWQETPREGTQNTLPLDISSEAEMVLEHMRGNNDTTANDMCQTLGLPYARITAILFELEMADLITSIPGGKFLIK